MKAVGEIGGSRSPCQVLFLCTGNSARSIMAEALLNHLGRGRFVAHSAGSHPNGRVHPLALATLGLYGIEAGNPRSKSWEEFAAPGEHPAMDAIITVCDNAAGETCPVWPGHPVTAHWGVPDPAAAEGTEHRRREAFVRACGLLRARIEALIAAPVETLANEAFRDQLRAIGRLHARGDS
jgi:arsenate reductase